MTSYLYFPFWVRVLSRFQSDGDDGLTQAERAHMARRKTYARTVRVERTQYGRGALPLDEIDVWLQREF